MGYTHYFRIKKTGIPQSAWEAICADVKTLFSNLPEGITIAFEADEPNRKPEISAPLIRFNGIGEDGHETFYFERAQKQVPGFDEGDDTFFAFCKTSSKPYDIVVCGALIVAAKHAGRYVTITSDGDLDDWMPAFEWVSSILGDEFMAGAVANRLKGKKFQLGGDDSTDYASIGNPTPDAETDDDTPVPEPITTSHTFIVDVKEFRAALEMAVAEKKTTIPVLQTVFLSPQGSSLQVVSTDLDKWTLTDVPAMIPDGAGTVLLPHRKTLELLKGETGILKITAKITTLKDVFSHGTVRLEVGGCEYDIPTLNPDSFPQAPAVPAVGFDVDGADLKASIGRVIGCISTEESRYTLNGALLECDKSKLLLVATDGHRLALDSIPLSEARKGKAIIPRDSLAWLYKYSAEEMVITFGEEQSFFHVGTTIFITRNVKGNFPNWQAVTPHKDSFTLTASFASGDDLAKPLAKVARMTDERSGQVKFRINGHFVLSAESCDTGKASATVKASIKHSDSDAEIAAGFNSFYVLDVLKIAGKSPVILSMKDSQSAGVFTVPSLPEYQYVLMPMRL